MNVIELLHQALAKQQAGDVESAKGMYRQVLAAAPRNADAHHLLGCIFRSEGKLNEAIASIGTAISISSGQPSFYNNLGTCYSNRDERVAAELCFRQALSIDPAYADAWSNLGLALIEALRFDEARVALEQACKVAPTHSGILCNLGQAYYQLSRYGEALAMYGRATALYPSSAAALLGSAGCQTKLNRNEEALATVERLLTLGSVNAEAMRMKGTILEVLGRIDEACEAFDSAIRAKPNEANLMFFRASVRKISKEEPFFAHLMQFEHRAEQVPAIDRGQLYYALGKTYQDIGDIGAAAKSYAAGASLQLLTSDFDEQDDRRLYAAMRNGVTADDIEKWKVDGSDSARPIFILGMPRSGTTLVEQILASHPAVFAAGELPFASEVLEGLVLAGGIRLGHATSKMPADATLRQRADAYLSKVDAWSVSAKERYFTDKLPENYFHLGLLAVMFPNARIIHCRRDPVDTCISCYGTLFTTKHYWSYDFGALGRTYRRYWDLMQHWRTIMPGRFLDVRYEQVVGNTEQTARILLDWCGLDWDERVLRFYETNRPINTASVLQVRQPIYQSSVGRWKRWEPYIQPLLAEIADIEKQYWAELDK